MVKQAKKPAQKKKKIVQFEPDRVFFMIVIVAVLTLVFIGALTSL